LDKARSGAVGGLEQPTAVACTSAIQGRCTGGTWKKQSAAGSAGSGQLRLVAGSSYSSVLFHLAEEIGFTEFLQHPWQDRYHLMARVARGAAVGGVARARAIRRRSLGSGGAHLQPALDLNLRYSYSGPFSR
jgi:hypothetical protein